MKIEENVLDLISDIEYLIGRECYNSKSYDGWKKTYGCSFRYPVQIPIGFNDFIKTNSTALPYIQKDPDFAIRGMSYKFGTNQLSIGQGIIDVLNYLEKRYNLNFNTLESERRSED